MMQKTRVKICGITRLDDLSLAIKYGADAVGFIFYKKSPRYVELAQAKMLTEATPAFVDTVAVFVDSTEEEVNAVLRQMPISLIQFNGRESAEFCGSFQHPYIKAIKMDEHVNLSDCEKAYKKAKGFLLDAYEPGQPCGSGEPFDWASIPAKLEKPLILASGLNSDNIGDAITQVKPYAVDVSRGVEHSPGVKDGEKIKSFMTEVKHADEQAN